MAGKQAPALAEAYEVICLLPAARSGRLGNIRFIGLPFFRWLGWRLVLVHPLILGYIVWLRPTVLHIYMPELLPIALLSRLFGVKVIYEVQENLRLKFDRKPRNNHPVFRWAFGYFDRQARRHCYHIFTENSYLITYTGLSLPHAVIHNYPDMAFFGSLPDTTPTDTTIGPGPHLLYVGVVSVDRGLDTMIQAIALLLPRYPAIRLHLFGRCVVSTVNLHALPGYADVATNLIFYGYTDPKVAYAQASRYVAGLALLHPVGDYPDSYPTKLFDYMALGLPVITSNFPLYQSVVEPETCGYCVDPGDANQVADYVSQFIGAPAMAKRMGAYGNKRVQRDYNWQKEGLQLLRFYEKIVLT